MARLDCDTAPEQCDSLAHADQTQPVTGSLRRVEALPVILDDCGHAFTFLRQHNADRVRVGVFDDIRERFLDDPVERGFDLWAESFFAECRLYLDLDLSLLSEGFSETFQRGDEPKVVQRLRPEL